eukprot:TRINITY_DN68080_c4_g3_i1.p1 TRINITY_DN68080_c4_g3~~TRINITY_DN68080_c4_g3_i1.p1  ORF type:complete len:247 (+),score=6.08 TRINITY_DN68080_c4_g3_i1:38-778(+)
MSDVSPILAALDSAIQNNTRLFSLVKAIRNGLIAGCKIRFPHAFVASFVSARGRTTEESFTDIIEITTEHARRLGTFVFLFKTMLYSMEWAMSKEHPIQPFIAGLIGGWIVFGEKTRMTEQINLYLLSRILMALAKVILQKCKNGGVVEEDGPLSSLISRYGFKIFASVVWGFVMWLFYCHTNDLQGGLRSSMTYLYKDSEKFNDWRSLIVHNKPSEHFGKWWINAGVGIMAMCVFNDFYFARPSR